MNFFSKKLPAWLLLAALVVVGAGAATGLVLKDQINGTTTIAVSQALEVETPIELSTSDADEFLASVNDNGVEWAVHFEANNGDVVAFALPIINNGGSDDIVAMLTLNYPAGLTIEVATSWDTGTVNDNTAVNDEISQYAPSIDSNTWKFNVGASADGDQTTVGTWDVRPSDDESGPDQGDDDDGIEITIAIEDAQPTGFYTITGTIVPVNV